MREYWIGHNVVGFDGTVLEIFGATDVHRYHLYHLRELTLSRSRSGRRSLSIYAHGGRGLPCLGDLDETAMPAVEALIADVNAARRARGWPEVPCNQ